MTEKNKHGQYVNPGNQGFQLITNSNYVDKTMLIDLLNAKVGTTERLVCVSRPRRFGKSFAAQIERIHREETSPLHYNKEDSLRSVIKLAYYTYRDYYVQQEELPSGEGYADVAYLPKYDSEYPILLIELKWNKDVQTAIDQIKAKHYPDSFKGYGREIILVGITYDKETKKYICKIEKMPIE